MVRVSVFEKCLTCNHMTPARDNVVALLTLTTQAVESATRGVESIGCRKYRGVEV